MKNLLTLVLSSFAFTVSYSQLLRGEIYDFSIGDYYGIHHVESNNQPGSAVTWQIQMFHILEKQLSDDGDSVIYSAQRQTYMPQLGPGQTPSLQIDTFQFSHFHLNSFYSPTDLDLIFGNQPQIIMFWFDDTTGCYSQPTTLSDSDFCPSIISQSFSYGMQIDPSMGNCAMIYGIEPYISDYTVFSHAGGPYGGKQNSGDWDLHRIHLVYVNHNGTECGYFPSYFLNLEEANPLKISVSPNPCIDNISVNGIEAVKSFVLSTSEGRIMDNVTLNSLTDFDVSKLATGIYFLHVTDNQDKSGIVRFIKN
ncbi:T9SS type A sorting domain-containing protein [Fluviicola sp.]|jgi:hypothetical protein|uniref:T9SS type A sorting domain-containing protein n=1 Tax=Fluviicola sp. TaxID=1917219 RepID=UPI00281822A4|nr:T9SS type A sorting domain-containing protein [Fluviicola sp.]MDR0801104.1 T9SS type A sorting domain-containing protein [Fluviicola sp.]